MWLDKGADRIPNLAPQPEFWDREKRKHYLQDAIIIHKALQDANKYLRNCLLQKIEGYRQYF